MTTEQYSIGYEDGYQDGWNESQDAQNPHRTWVGLTQAECGMLWKVDMTPCEYYQAIEAKLKEKNGL